MNILGFELVSEEKYARAKEVAGEDNEKELLAQYDKLGGLITKDGEKVATGSFYDFKAKKARFEPLVSFEKPKEKKGTIVENVGDEEETPAQKKLREKAEKAAEEKIEKKRTKTK